MSNINDSIVKRAATESLARVALQTPQHPTPAPTVYDNGVYREHFSTAVSTSTDPVLPSQPTAYNGMTGPASHPYNMGNPVPIPQQSSSSFDHHSSFSSDDTGLTANHVAALTAASNNTPQSSSDGYSYANTQVSNSSHQPTYTTNGFAPQDWRQWTRTYTQMGPPGEYLNTATTLMTLGRDGASQVSGSEGQGLVDSSGIQGQIGHHWPEILFPGAAGHMGHH
jgi:hypothetical protein